MTHRALRLRVLAATIALLAGLSAPERLHAQAPPAPGRVPASVDSSPAESSRAAAESTRVDTTRPARPAPPRDYVAEVRAGFTPENRAYATTQTALGFIDPIYGILVNLFLLFSGLAGRMRNVANAMGHRLYVRVLVFLVLYSLAGLVLSFPLTWYEGFALEHQYGLSNQTLSAWLADLGKGELLAIGTFGLIPIVALAYHAIQRHPRRWEWWLAAGALPVILAGALLEPVVVDPVFNQFRPLRNERLKGEILGLAERAGIPARDVYVVDKSKQTKTYNAYVNGIGASQRIVLWDTTLHGMKDDEIQFVMAHEMGHYRLHHVWKGIVLVWLLGIAFFAVTATIVRRATARFGGRWGFHEIHDVASIPLLVLTLSFMSLVTQPLANAVSRRFEHEADTYALEITHANDAGARAFIALASQNRSDPEPSPIIEFIQYTHPPLIERIRFAMTYRPWEQGEPNRFYVPMGDEGS